MSKPSRRKYEDLEAENARLKARLSQIRRYGVFSGTTKVSGELVRTARVVLPFFFIWLCVREVAGKTTAADVKADVSLAVESQTFTDLLQSFLDSNLFTVLAIIVGIVGILYGRLQAKLRKDTVEHLQGPKIRRELSVDPRRSTSALTTRGETRPEDE